MKTLNKYMKKFLFIVLLLIPLISASNTLTDNGLNTTGNVTAIYYFGNGSLLTGLCLSNGSNCLSSINTSDFILKNGSTTTTALIPFALGWSSSNPSLMVGSSALYLGSQATIGGKLNWDSSGVGTLILRTHNEGGTKIGGASMSIITQGGSAPASGSASGGNLDITLGNGQANVGTANGGRMQIQTGLADGGQEGYVSIGSLGSLTNVRDSLSVDGSLETYTDNYLYGVADGMLKLSGSKIDTAVDGTDYQGVITAVNPLFLSSNTLTINTSMFCLTNGTGCSASSINETNLVHINGTETITGNKTFSQQVAINDTSQNSFYVYNATRTMVQIDNSRGRIGIGGNISTSDILLNMEGDNTGMLNIGRTKTSRQSVMTTFGVTDTLNWTGNGATGIRTFAITGSDNRILGATGNDLWQVSRYQILRNPAFAGASGISNVYVFDLAVQDFGKYNRTTGDMSLTRDIFRGQMDIFFNVTQTNGRNMTLSSANLRLFSGAFAPQEVSGKINGFYDGINLAVSGNPINSSVNVSARQIYLGWSGFNKTWGIYQDVSGVPNYFQSNVGIGTGTSTPSTTLDVNGNLTIRGNFINMSALPTGSTGTDTDYLCINITSGRLFRNETGC